MSNVTSIFKNKSDDLEYRKKITLMGKISLLEEMVRFQEERTKKGILTLTMMTQGIILFGELAARAETPEMKSLATTYKRHLEHHLAHQRNKHAGS